MTPDPVVGDDEYAFWRFDDLLERRIISSRADLANKQKAGFPRPIKLAKGRGGAAIFNRAAVKAWINQQRQQA
jgi:predicted DNA-binding transcriptional regulator AlpA